MNFLRAGLRACRVSTDRVSVLPASTSLVKLRPFDQAFFYDFRSCRLPGWISGLPLARTRPDRLFSMISGLGGSWAGFPNMDGLSQGTGQTRSDRTFSMISKLGGCRAGFPDVNGLSRGIVQTHSDRQFSMIPGSAAPRLHFQLPGQRRGCHVGGEQHDHTHNHHATRHNSKCVHMLGLNQTIYDYG